MKPEYKELLVECYRRQRQHAATPRPPKWQKWDCELFDEETDYGPPYASGDWFGDIPEHQRMRYRRAITDLERNGFLVTWAKYDRRLTSIKLTENGEAAAKELLAAIRLERRKADR